MATIAMTFNSAADLFRIEDGLYNAQIVTAQEERLQAACLRLRYGYFVRQRGWVTDDPAMGGRESDAYDDHAFHLAVFDREEALAYLRVLPAEAPCGFMLEHEFSSLLNSHPQNCRESIPSRSAHAVELSRLVYRPLKSQDRQAGAHPVELLLKLLYRLALERGIQLFYIVVEERWLKPFARRFGLLFTPLGTPHVFPDGTRTVAAVATLAQLQDSMRQHSATKFNWYHE